MGKGQSAPLPGAFRPNPPTTAAIVRWPEAFGTRFVVMVDTEEEFDWGAPLARGNIAVSAIAALPDTHRRFAERGVPMIYMIDYPIATDPRARDVLAGAVADGVSAIGTQLHPWVNPPFAGVERPIDSFAGNLPITAEAAKIDALTQAIEAGFGTRPCAFRAGRYGIGPATWGLLADRGYLIDSSIRPAYDYSAEGGPDFSRMGNAAYRAGPGGKIVELPLTTVFTGAGRRGGGRLFRLLGSVPRGRGLFARTGLLSRVALTPEDMPIADALEAVAVALGEGQRVLNFSFHSPSIAPGHTPYVRDAADLAGFHRWWDLMLSDLDRRGVRPASLVELVAASRGHAA